MVYAILFAATLFSSTASAQSGRALGDTHGNTFYQILDHSADCGYSEKEGGDYIRILAYPDNFVVDYLSRGGYFSARHYSVMHYGEVSRTTVGVARGYTSDYEFYARESHRAPYSKDGPITLTEEFFVLDRTGLLIHSKSVNGQIELRCRYQKI